MEEPRLVGRDVDLSRLEEELTRAGRGELRCVLVEGRPGIGKSRLTRELLARHPRDVVGMAARAFPLGASAAFGLWAEALEGHLRGLSAPEVRRLCAGAVDELSGLLRSVVAVAGPGPRPEPSRARLLAALAVLLRRLAALQPVVVALDDVHLADPSSLEALHYLVHNAADARVLVVATARPDELAKRPSANTVLLRLEQDGLLIRRPVVPIGEAHLAELAGGMLGADPPPALVRWLAERSRGNPLYAIGLLRALLEEGADLGAPVLRRLPEPLAGRVGLRLHGLDHAALAVVELMAVLGRPAELRLLVALTGRTPDHVADTVDLLVGKGILLQAQRGLELVYDFDHPLVAEAVYQRIGATRLRRLHRVVGRTLISAGRAAEAAGHFVCSAGPGDDEAVAVLRDAVHAAERAEAYQEALILLDALAALLGPGDPRWQEVVDVLSWDAQWVVDHRADSHAVLAIPALRTMDAALATLDDPARQAPVKLRLASFLAWGAGELAEAATLCEQAQVLFATAGDRRGALLAASELGWTRGLGGDLAGLERAARELARIAAADGDPVVHARAVRTLGFALLLRGQLDEAEATLELTRRSARAAGDRFRAAVATINLGLVLVARGEIEAGLATLERTRRDVPDVGAEYHTFGRWLAGDVRGAVDAARAPDGVASMIASPRLGPTLWAAALSAVEAGEAADGRRWAERARALPGGLRLSCGQALADWFDGSLARRSGRPEEALPPLRRAATAILRAGWEQAAVGVLVDVAELVGRQDGAAARGGIDGAGQLADLAERSGLPVHRAAAALGAGWVRLGGGDRAGARALAATAADGLVGWPFYRARALHLLGLSSEDREGAVAALSTAAALFGRCGAACRHAEQLDALARLGSRGRRAAAAAAGPSSLTPREREVARLAASGMSAREIGASLYIGERTVEGHLARVYARLGVRSKVELAARAAELGVTAES